MQGKLGLHPDNASTDIDLKKGPQVHPYQAVRQQEKLDEEILQRMQAVVDLRGKKIKLRQQLAEDIQVSDSAFTQR